jgi:hypothetical protein
MLSRGWLENARCRQADLLGVEGKEDWPCAGDDQREGQQQDAYPTQRVSPDQAAVLHDGDPNVLESLTPGHAFLTLGSSRR